MKRLTLVLLGLVLAACTAQPPVPEDRFYRLVVPRVAPGTRMGAITGTIAVREMASDGLHSERAMLYSEDPGQRVLQQYHYHFWLDAPPRLAQDYLVAYLRKIGIAERVVEGHSGIAGTYTVSGRLKRFEQLLDQGNFRTIVELELRLWSPDATVPVMVKDYRAMVPVGSGVTAAVQGYEKALDGIAAEFADDIHRRIAAVDRKNN